VVDARCLRVRMRLEHAHAQVDGCALQRGDFAFGSRCSEQRTASCIHVLFLTFIRTLHLRVSVQAGALQLGQLDARAVTEEKHHRAIAGPSMQRLKLLLRHKERDEGGSGSGRACVVQTCLIASTLVLGVLPAKY
jgi:hypothetical protein